MGYRVDYRPVRKMRRIERTRMRLPVMTAGFFLAFLVLVNSCWPRGRAVLREIMVSGNLETAANALETLAVQLRDGDKLSSAAEVFYDRIVEGTMFDSD